MSKRSRLSQHEVLAVMRLMADIAAHRRQPAVQRRLLVERMEKLVGATIGFSFVCDGWKPGMVPRFLDTHILDGTAGIFDYYVNDILVPHTIHGDPYCDVALRRTAEVDMLTQRDVLPTKAILDKYGPFSAWGAGVNLRDGIVSWARLDGQRDGAIAGVAVHRLDADRPFTARHRAMVELATAELRRLAANGWFSLPEFNPQLADRVSKLPPRLRQVLSLVLAGRHPKGIALDLNLSLHTVREHLQRLYRCFEVSSREELMARFIGSGA